MNINYAGNTLKIKNALVGNGFKAVSAKAFGKAGNQPVMLENTYGKGKAILLNFTTQDEKFHSFFGNILTKLNLPQLFTCRTLDIRYQTHDGVVNASRIRKEQSALAGTPDKSATEDAGERETLVYENSPSKDAKV